MGGGSEAEYAEYGVEEYMSVQAGNKLPTFLKKASQWISDQTGQISKYTLSFLRIDCPTCLPCGYSKAAGAVLYPEIICQ